MMLPSINSYSILYTLFAWLLGLCYGFVLLSSAAGQNSDVKVFKSGESLTYRLHSTVLLDEKDGKSKNVGFSVNGDIIVKCVWGEGNQKLLKIELRKLELSIKSRKAPTPDGFVRHWSGLDSAKNKPFLIVWDNGKIDKILVTKDESIFISNLKKSIASLFQLQILDGEFQETDVSGKCSVTYISTSATKITKIKSNCLSEDFNSFKNPNEILKTRVQSTRQIEYELDPAYTHFKSIKSTEDHIAYLAIKEDIGNHVRAEEILTLVTIGEVEVIQDNNINDAIETIRKSEGTIYTSDTLLTEQEIALPEDIQTFTKEVDNLRHYLKVEYSGTLKPAKAFLKLVTIARVSTKDDISKTLTSKKNKQIIYQLYDILGNVQTSDSHAAVVKELHFDREEQIDSSERYLWALSFSSRPNADIIEDLLKKFTKYVNIPEKVKETLILTIASMAYKLRKLQKSDDHFKVIDKVEEVIINNLDYAKAEDKIIFFRALKNLKSPSTIPYLLNYIKNGTQKEGVLAWKAIQSFNPELWDDDVLNVAEKTFFQLDRKYDTSSRTLSAEILIQSNPSDQLLEDFLNFLISNDPTFEIKQYIFQHIKMISGDNPLFRKRIETIIKRNPKLNNYSGLSPRGLSTALTRRFLTSDSSNGSLVSVQEMKSGIAKRGIVNVVLEKDGLAQELFSLGIFSGGLHSFISSDSAVDEDAEEEATTAGMELTVLETQIRPFVFFNGQGELMGHVWSGTASEMTPALQVLAMLQDHSEYIRLGTGCIANIEVKGATSFDLSGKFELSLWNRNADSLVQKSAGIITVGSITVDTMFVKSKVEFSASMETRLDLKTDLDFSSQLQLCMRLTQPDSLFRHNIFKIERIPGSKHKLRISKYKKSIVPGTTYSINKKNDGMCSAIFS